jgi:hypothetical protein
MAFFNPHLGLGVLSGVTLVEPTAAEYQRQYPFTFSTFPGGTGVNDSAASFGMVVSNWGTLTSWGLFDDAGNQVLCGDLVNAISGAPGQMVTVLAGQIPLAFAAKATEPAAGMTLFGTFSGSGTGQASATLLNAITCIISNAASGPFVLPNVAAGVTIYVKNQDPNNSAKIFPGAGVQINEVGANQPIAIASNATVSFILESPTQWIA